MEIWETLGYDATHEQAPQGENGEKATEATHSGPATKPLPKCGIVMPISAIDTYTEKHWIDVRSILSDAIKTAGFKPNLVSEAEDVGIIQARIVENLYDNPMVVCDISAKNPNVMFELGLRLAFDKPTILVRDNATSFPFDTGQIEHLTYPRDLRFGDIVEFKERLSEKITQTFQASRSPEFTTFLKHFKRVKVAQLETQEVSGSEFVVGELKRISDMVAALHTKNQSRTGSAVLDFGGATDLTLNVPFPLGNSEVDAYLATCRSDIRANATFRRSPNGSFLHFSNVTNHEAERLETGWQTFIAPFITAVERKKASALNRPVGSA